MHGSLPVISQTMHHIHTQLQGSCIWLIVWWVRDWIIWQNRTGGGRGVQFHCAMLSSTAHALITRQTFAGCYKSLLGATKACRLLHPGIAIALSAARRSAPRWKWRRTSLSLILPTNQPSCTDPASSLLPTLLCLQYK